ncbi:hypothetical protein ACFV9E_06665 [Streptomyces sp. NPDC059835]|uniref:hypothetical protein n=1 Tax=Streptomyces sp. NPDC059835 TaxID=3346967 RepID=UPI003654225F
MNPGYVSPEPNRPASDTHIAGGHLTAQVATLIALAAAGLALIDYFANGLSQTLVHLVLAFAVFATVRLSVGVALAPYRPAAYDDPENHP